MSSAAEHSTFNLLAVTITAAMVDVRGGRPLTVKPLALGMASACLPSLPDWIEPAIHPNHRKFFHSVAFGAAMGYGMNRLYHWQPEEEWESLLRVVALTAGSAYLAHLLCDAFTAKSLPLI